MVSDDSIGPGAEKNEKRDRARSGAPAAGEAVGDRFSTDEIFQRVVATADEEVESSTQKLYLSGLAAGFAITITFYFYATGKAMFPTEAGELLAPLLYPVGFVYIIMGRYQLYTENTLTPVALVLTGVASIPALLRVWGVVLAGNMSGAVLGALVLAKTGVLSPEAAVMAVEIGSKGITTPWTDLLFKAIFAGWLVAGLVWLEHAVRDSISRVILIYLIIFTIPATGLFHVVVSSSEVAYLIFTGNIGVFAGVWEFIIPVLVGNTIGGVFLVTLLNYGQTKHRFPNREGVRQTLSIKDWLFSFRVSKPKNSSANPENSGSN